MLILELSQKEVSLGSEFRGLYYIEYRKEETESKVSILVDDLVKAKD